MASSGGTQGTPITPTPGGGDYSTNVEVLELFNTILPLDTARAIMGIDPYHFWQMTYTGHPTSQTCAGCYTHHRWQQADSVGRHDMLNAIVESEQTLADILMFYPGPKYTELEDVRLKKPRQIVQYQLTPYKLFTEYKKIQQVGQLTYTTIELDKALAYPASGDDVTITQTVTAGVAACEVIICYPGTFVEIRPIEISISGTTATITVKRWLMGDPDNWADDVCVDAADTSNLLSSVDIYRKWYDPSLQITLVWEPYIHRCGCLNLTTCTVCQNSSITACAVRDEYNLGVVAWQAATWNATTEAYEDAALICSLTNRFPDIAYINYLHGAPPDRGECYMSRMWSRLVTILANANMDDAPCACSNVLNFSRYWREDMGKSSDTRSFLVSSSGTESMLGGHRRGHLHVWDAIRRKIEQ